MSRNSFSPIENQSSLTSIAVSVASFTQNPVSSMASSSASSPRSMKYHVFLSFRGEDTRLNFTAHLLQALTRKELEVFFDERNLKKRESLALALSNAIADSNLSIIVLSADYASSKSCLAELSNVVARRQSREHIVLPIFYHVDPSDVQNLRGSFKKSFEDHESNAKLGDEVKRWKVAFGDVGTLKGIHVKGDKSEADHIKHIVEYVIQKSMKHQVFLSLGEDTRLNFTSHLIEALEDTGIHVFSDQGEQMPFSDAIAASNLSIIVLSKDYASSKSCLAQLSNIMDRKHKEEHIVLPIFYHVDPSDVRNVGGSFKTSFDDHETNGLWRKNFAEVGQLKGWHIEGGTFDRSDSEYINDVIQYIIKELNRKSRSTVSEDLVGLDYQKEKVLRLIEQEDSRLIGLWGMGGIGKTTLADTVYNEISLEFQRGWFLQNVRQEVQKKGMKDVRNELLSKLLGTKIDIDSPTIGSTFIRERLSNLKALVVLDDVSDPDQIDCMGVKYFGKGSKIIITSRDLQVLRIAGVQKIRRVQKLNEKDSLQLFSTFAFKLLNPAPNFQDLSNKFLGYAQGNPLALKVLGSKLYTKSRQEWESEVEKLKEYMQPNISHILRSSYDGLDEQEKNVFLDVACFLKGEPEEEVIDILSWSNKGVESGISNLVDKCLFEKKDTYRGSVISMHDMLEDMGKDIVRQNSEDPANRTRLWNLHDVNQVLRYNEVNKLIKGIKLETAGGELLSLFPPGLENLLHLRYIHLSTGYISEDKKLLAANMVDGVSLPAQLRYLCWIFYPFKSLPPSFNPKNLVRLKLPSGYMEQLWNEEYQDLINLREIDVSDCRKLRKIPNLSRASNLGRLVCSGCDSLVELPYLGHLKYLEKLEAKRCRKLKKFPKLPNVISELDLSDTGIKKVPDSIQHLVKLGGLILSHSRVEHVSSNISKLESLRMLDLRRCKRLKTLPELPRYMWCLEALDCTALEEVSFTYHNFNPFHESDAPPPEQHFSMTFLNCRSLSQDSIKNIGVHAMLQMESLAQRWARKGTGREEIDMEQFFCCFPGDEVPEDVFYYGSMNSSLHLKLSLNGCGGRRFLAFAFCVVANLTCASEGVQVSCKYQLTAAGGDKFTTWPCHFCYIWNPVYKYDCEYEGDHVFIVSSEEMIILDNDYVEASFEFSVESNGRDDEVVEKCGVQVFYVDAESYAIIDVHKTSQNFDSQEDATIEEAHHHSAAEMRRKGKGRIGEDGRTKRLK